MLSALLLVHSSRVTHDACHCSLAQTTLFPVVKTAWFVALIPRIFGFEMFLCGNTKLWMNDEDNHDVQQD
jgi:hypothetical protein